MKLKLLIPIPLTQDSVTKLSVETPGSVINLTADPSEVDMCDVDVDIDDLDDIAVVAHSGDGYKKPLEFDYEVIDDPKDDLTDEDSDNDDSDDDLTPEPILDDLEDDS